MWCSFSEGRYAGNGTDVLVCDRRRPRVELTDYFEATESYDRDLPYRSRYRTVELRLEELFSEAEKFEPALAQRFRAFATQFLTLNDVQMERHSLLDLPDSPLEFMPSRCETEQLIIRRGQDRGSLKKFW